MKIEIEVTVDDELRSELVLQFRDLICALRVQDIEVTATLEGAPFEVECHEDDDALDGYYDPAIESVPLDESWEDGENEELNDYIDAENHFGEGYSDDEV